MQFNQDEFCDNVARVTGRPRYIVSQCFLLICGAHLCGYSLAIFDHDDEGRQLTFVEMPTGARPVPVEFMILMDEFHDDLMDLLDIIYDALPGHLKHQGPPHLRNQATA